MDALDRDDGADHLPLGGARRAGESRPVSLTGVSGATPHGIRIGPVYTPSAFRGRGYASALVAEVSQEQLDAGRRFCFLYTDLANPTSNKIYQAIGYRPVTDALRIDFRHRGRMGRVKPNQPGCGVRLCRL